MNNEQPHYSQDKVDEIDMNGENHFITVCHIRVVISLIRRSKRKLNHIQIYNLL